MHCLFEIGNFSSSRTAEIFRPENAVVFLFKLYFKKTLAIVKQLGSAQDLALEL